MRLMYFIEVKIYFIIIPLISFNALLTNLQIFMLTIFRPLHIGIGLNIAWPPKLTALLTWKRS
jgi:hypothetical protein